VKVKDLMATKVKSCATYNTLKHGAQAMWDSTIIGCVPVVDNDRRVVGMLTTAMSAWRLYSGRAAYGLAGDQRDVEAGVFLCA